jgi:hypothetical protein
MVLFEKDEKGEKNKRKIFQLKMVNLLAQARKMAKMHWGEESIIMKANWSPLTAND